MKLSEKLKLYTNYFVLLFIIILLFIILNLISNNEMYIDLFGKRIKASEDILINENNEHYLSYNYIKENLDEEIYFDNVSKKILISSEVGLFKVKVNEKSININFEDAALNSVGMIEKGDKYISLEVIKKAYDLNISRCNNTIYIYANDSFDGKVKNNNVSLYIDGNLKSKIVNYVDKKDKIEVICEKNDFVFVKVNENKVGYILKKLVNYSIKTQEVEENNIQNSTYIFSDANNKSIKSGLPIDGVLVDMFEVTQISGSVNLKSVNTRFLNSIKQNNYSLYGIVNNGYNLSAFTTSTMSQILADETKRLTLINNLCNKIEEYKLDGIVLDFRRLKEKDISNYIQFVKEFKAFSDKEVVVNIDAVDYKNYISVINYSDFSILNVYGQRDLNSTVAGSVSELSWMKEVINTALKVADKDKLIIGLPAYSILWTEKNSNIIDSEIYNLNAIQDYIKKNSLDTKKVNGQNYAQLKKGSLIYRLWIEDEFSIKNRLDIITSNNLAGVAIYKLGYENDTLISVLENN